MAKCVDCGYLCQRVWIGMVPQGMIEVEENARMTGAFPRWSRNVDIKDGAPPNVPLPNPNPLCFVRALRLDLERDDAREAVRGIAIATDRPIEGEISREQVNLHIITRNRECASWVKWQPGDSPKEHREMQDSQKLLEREDNWQKFQAQMAEDDRKWREEQEAKAEERHQRELQTIKDINKTQMWVMGGLVTLVIVLVTVISGVIEAGWVPKWFGIGQPQVEQSITPPVSNTKEFQSQESP